MTSHNGKRRPGTEYCYIVSKPPSWNEIRTNAQQFATRWEGTSDENAESQSFWNEFLGIFGIDRKRVATFEARAKRESTGGRGRIDLLWPGTLVAEHKSAGKDLATAETQALDYLESIDIKDFPGVIVTSDFGNFRVRDRPKCTAATMHALRRFGGELCSDCRCDLRWSALQHLAPLHRAVGGVVAERPVIDGVVIESDPIGVEALGRGTVFDVLLILALAEGGDEAIVEKIGETADVAGD